MLRAIRIPPLQHDQRGNILEAGTAARAGDIRRRCCCYCKPRPASGIVSDARIALGSVAATIVRSPAAEDFLPGRLLSPDVIAEAGRLASASVKPIDDVRGSAEYRGEMVKMLVVRALRQLAADAPIDNIPARPPMLWGADEGIVKHKLPAAIALKPDTPIESRVNGVAVLYRGLDSTSHCCIGCAMRSSCPVRRKAAPKANAARAQSFSMMWRLCLAWFMPRARTAPRSSRSKDYNAARNAASDSAGFHRSSGRAMRILHAGIPHGGPPSCLMKSKNLIRSRSITASVAICAVAPATTRSSTHSVKRRA